VFGALAERQPEGASRGAYQRSLEDIERQAGIAQGALITAAVTALFTAVIAVRYWDQIMGRPAHSAH